MLGGPWCLSVCVRERLASLGAQARSLACVPLARRLLLPLHRQAARRGCRHRGRGRQEAGPPGERGVLGGVGGAAGVKLQGRGCGGSEQELWEGGRELRAGLRGAGAAGSRTHDCPPAMRGALQCEALHCEALQCAAPCNVRPCIVRRPAMCTPMTAHLPTHRPRPRAAEHGQLGTAPLWPCAHCRAPLAAAHGQQGAARVLPCARCKTPLAAVLDQQGAAPFWQPLSGHAWPQRPTLPARHPTLPAAPSRHPTLPAAPHPSRTPWRPAA